MRVLLIAVLLLSCSRDMADIDITDKGVKQIGYNLFVKKLDLGNGDRLYLLVDGEGNLAGKGTSVSHTYTRLVGKTTVTEVQSSAVLQE